MNNHGIFIFTRDRPDILKKTLGSLINSLYKIFIVDDSVIETNYSINRRISITSGCTYLGKDEFNKFILHYRIEMPKHSFLLRELGYPEWNLGHARNFALLFAKSILLNEVLFMDDDIEINDLSLIERLFVLKNNYKFVGANILGLVDDSILGHIATDIGIYNERMISGGCMVFNPFEIAHFFLNNYNEDWIWLFLQLKEAEYIQTGDVYQAIKNPLDNYKSKVIFQEFGEILLDGVLDLYADASSSYDFLQELEFWQRILIERKEYLYKLLHTATDRVKYQYSEIIEYVQTQSGDFDAAEFRRLFEEYFDNRQHFQLLYQSFA